ncbi:MAG: type II toxin-antitoxin system RelE/ParE family toxin [Calditrichaeota bacterium]|nr:MAG: type II toxin-antitoxin system RelE/ParE family toxin [Calditrichota bacterium]
MPVNWTWRKSEEKPKKNDRYRQQHVNHHMVFYRVTTEKIIIVRVLGESMDYKRHIK